MGFMEKCKVFGVHCFNSLVPEGRGRMWVLAPAKTATVVTDGSGLALSLLGCAFGSGEHCVLSISHAGDAPDANTA